ncbi:hypothetical protein WR25_00543 [Diploscapter pachys]|uniref:Uncharacterized protein n=1 Tax=Diploscapter pachys TaxID=2018661 RepID=A0A2A2M3J6_9BILA|nr:hypothetical protein WR25_00543 [Diploscapter pachys]
MRAHQIDRPRQPFLPIGRLDPDIGLQPPRLAFVGQIDRRDIDAPHPPYRDRHRRRRRPAPVGREHQRRVRRPHPRAAKVEAIMPDHQVQSRARPDLEQLDPRAVACGDMQQPGHQPRRPPDLVGLRRPVQPRPDRRIVPRQRRPQHVGNRRRLDRLAREYP